ncbi:MAG: asparagine synthase (glutamine-hydrolyzing) [Planctomycetes bacterium]|nr:asparagine synthase (glutamine-hydrolyzing) [Planctomycetota bacterium]
MCGIAGLIGAGPFTPGDLERLSERLEHRGPDGFGFAVSRAGGEPEVWHDQPPKASACAKGEVALVHRRLAILDLSQDSAQPMLDPERGCALVFNGEVYNYVELRETLRGLGHQFVSSGDTEVVLRAYLEWGTNFLRWLRGMFALAIYDSKARTVLLARDRFGIKPLLLTRHRGGWAFASEVKGLLALPGYVARPDEAQVLSFLLTGCTDRSSRTFFAGVEALAPGTFMEISLDAPESVRRERYWSPHHLPSFSGSLPDAVARFQELFESSLNLHLRSDVPIGTCLSGGLDSSSIVTTSARLGSQRHISFGYCASDTPFDEYKYMVPVAKAAGSRLVQIRVDPASLDEALGRILRHQDEPFGSASIVAQWFVFERVSQEGLKVVLDGQGADEILGGYHMYFDPLVRSFIKQGRLREAHRVLREFQKLNGTPLLSRREAIGDVVPARLKGAYGHMLRVLGRYLPESHAQPTPQAVQPDVFLSSSWARTWKDEALDFSAAPASDQLSARLAHDVASAVLPALLRFEDRNSMAHSVEARVPFLDHELAEFCLSLPDQLRLRGTETKLVLREAMKGILPEGVRSRRDKIGFRSAPELTFGYAARHFSRLLEPANEHEEEWFDTKGVRALFESPHRSINQEFITWRVICTKLWARQHWGEA